MDVFLMIFGSFLILASPLYYADGKKKGFRCPIGTAWIVLTIVNVGLLAYFTGRQNGLNNAGYSVHYVQAGNVLFTVGCIVVLAAYLLGASQYQAVEESKKQPGDKVDIGKKE